MIRILFSLIFSTVLFATCNVTLTAPDPSNLAKIKAHLGKRTMVISKRRAENLAQKLNVSMDQLMMELVPYAEQFARPPVSQYKVGVVAQGKSGDLLLGVNYEIPGAPLNHTVHAEQFVMVLALLRNETEITAMAMTGSGPCGFCRQALKELHNADKVRYLIPPKTKYKNKTEWSLEELMPDSFGPTDLGIHQAFLGHQGGTILKLDGILAVGLVETALKETSNAYVPYTKFPAGLAIQTKTGKIFRGTALENAAFNPSISPIHVALVHMISEDEGFENIEQVMLIEKKGCQPVITYRETTKLVLQKIAPHANLTVFEGE